MNEKQLRKAQERIEREMHPDRRYVIIEGATASRPYVCFAQCLDSISGPFRWTDELKEARQFTGEEIDAVYDKINYDHTTEKYYSIVIVKQG